MLSDRLIKAMRSAFPDRGLIVDQTANGCLKFPAIHEAVGDILVFDDGDEFTIVFGNFTHSHVSCYDENLTDEEKKTRLIGDLVETLSALFNDQIVMWGSNQGSGGWYRRDSESMPRHGTHFVWLALFRTENNSHSFAMRS